MGIGEVVLVGVGISVVTNLAFEAARPKGARIFSKGPNGETDLLFDAKSIPPKK